MWLLKLYLAGQTAKSLAALANLKKICAQHIVGKYRIEVIDLVKNPALAKGDRIFATPTLVRKLPGPDPQDSRRPFQHGTRPGGAGPPSEGKPNRLKSIL